MTEDVQGVDVAVLAAIEWERARLARVLHDGPVQDLTAALLFFDSATADRATPDPELLQRGTETLQKVVRSCRRLLEQLSPVTADVGELTGRIRRQVIEDIAPAAAAAVDVDLGPRGDGVAADRLHTLLRIVEELVDNVARHGAQRLTRLSVSLEDGELVAVVGDAGPGGARLPDAGAVSGLGWSRRRAESLRGRLEVASDSTGTTVTVWLPVEGP